MKRYINHKKVFLTNNTFINQNPHLSTDTKHA